MRSTLFITVVFLFSLLQKGFACRGYITVGNIYHHVDGDFVGTGAHEVFEKKQ